MPTAGLLVTFSRHNDPTRADEWEAWYDDVHVPDVVAAVGARVATRWQMVQGVPEFQLGVGFTHVTIHELEADRLPGALDAYAAAVSRWFDDDRMHPNHVPVGVELLQAHGRWSEKPDPHVATTGHILAYVLCGDPRRAEEWDAWYDAEHIPDMLASDGFAAATRWARTVPAPFGANHVTLYDVELDPVDEAVRRSAAVMPGLVASGRKPPWHAGGLTVVVVPAGRHGPAGYRPTTRSGA